MAVVPSTFADHDGDQAVVAELVRETDTEAIVSRVGHQRFDLGLGAAARGEIELIALVDELRDARHVDRRELADDASMSSESR